MTGPETHEEKKEAAAIRRRWITLGEVLAVVAVTISGLTLWNSYSERNAAEAERAAEKQKEQTVARTLLLKATGTGKRMALAAYDPDQAIQSQNIIFPGAIGIDPIATLIEPRIEAAWIRKAIAGLPKDGKASGDARVPVAITTRFVSDGATSIDTAIYDVGYARDDGGLFGGTEVELLGLSLVERVKTDRAQQRLDALWKARSR